MTEPIGPTNNPKYKITLCQKWMKNGYCSYKEKCQFAHGQEELLHWRTESDKKLEELQKNYENNDSVNKNDLKENNDSNKDYSLERDFYIKNLLKKKKIFDYKYTENYNKIPTIHEIGSTQNQNNNNSCEQNNIIKNPPLQPDQVSKKSVASNVSKKTRNRSRSKSMNDAPSDSDDYEKIIYEQGLYHYKKSMYFFNLLVDIKSKKFVNNAVNNNKLSVC